MNKQDAIYNDYMAKFPKQDQPIIRQLSLPEYQDLIKPKKEIYSYNPKRFDSSTSYLMNNNSIIEVKNSNFMLFTIAIFQDKKHFDEYKKPMSRSQYFEF